MRALLLFARIPKVGKVKTRLANEIGPQKACLAYSLLLRHTITQARKVDATRVLMWADATPRSRRVRGFLTKKQQGGDLGKRMAAAFQWAFTELGMRYVVLIGSDCASLSYKHLLQAFNALERCDAVIGPAADGGYWLVGQRYPGADIFSGVPWSSNTTLEATIKRLKSLHITWELLESLNDVDCLSDLEASSHDLPGLQRYHSRRS